MRPTVSCAMIVVDAHTSIQVTPESPGTPAQWVTAYNVLTSATGLSCHRHPQRLSCELDTSVGCRAHTSCRTQESAVVLTHPRPPHPPRERDDRVSPLYGRDG